MGQFTTLVIDGEVARLTLARAEKRNALKRETLQEIVAAVGEVRSRRDIRALVLSGDGVAFCAGMDLEEMQQRATASDCNDQWRLDSQVYCDALQSIFSLPFPTIAAVNGAAVAGGVGLVLACDLVIVADSAFFMLPEPMRGITAAMVTPLLIHRVGPGAAGRLLLSGERWSAAQALQSGLAHDVVADESFQPRVDQLIKAIKSGSQQALAITKSHLLTMSERNVLQQLQASMSVSAEARQTGDAREGLDAFLQKRKPYWQPVE
jgi:methylglutaconyl-CoA hydratase